MRFRPEVICPRLLPFPPSGSSFWRWLPNIIWKHVIFYVNNLLHLSSKDQRNLFVASSISFVRPTLLFIDFKSIPPLVKIWYVYYFHLPIFSAQNTGSIEGPEGPQTCCFKETSRWPLTGAMDRTCHSSQGTSSGLASRRPYQARLS